MTMTLTSDVPFVSTFAAPTAVIRSLRAWFSRRAQRKTIAALLEMDPSRLNDLGLDTGDIRDALRGSVPAGSYLEARRSARAKAWAVRTGANG